MSTGQGHQCISGHKVVHSKSLKQSILSFNSHTQNILSPRQAYLVPTKMSPSFYLNYIIVCHEASAMQGTILLLGAFSAGWDDGTSIGILALRATWNAVGPVTFKGIKALGMTA